MGQATAVLVTIHNTPFGDIVDTEDELQPLVFSVFRDAIRAMTLVAAVLREAEVNTERLRARTRDGWITSTELADMLTREHGLPFRTSHAITAQLVEAKRRNPDLRLDGALADAAQSFGVSVPYDEPELQRLLSPEHFVCVRRTHGGPAPSETACALDRSNASLAGDEAWVAAAEEALHAARTRLRQRCAGL